MVSNCPDRDLGDNEITTTKTNSLTFLPVNLLRQLTQASNFYFLMISVMQMVPAITLTFGAPTVLLPLTLVVLVSLFKELFEEINRHRHDKQENKSSVTVLRGGEWVNAPAQTLLVGEIVRLTDGDKVMADVLLLRASDPQVYVETMSLDGETTKKGRRVAPELCKLVGSEQALQALRLRVEYQPPDPFLYKFEGRTEVEGKIVPLSMENVLLRGSIVRLTKWANAMVLYNGFNTKVMLNSAKPHGKRSRLDMNMQYLMIGLLIIMLMVTLGYALTSSLLLKSDHQPYFSVTSTRFIEALFTYWGTWILIISNFIPISLPITLDVINLIHAFLIERSNFNRALCNGRRPEVASSTLNSELGQISHVLSDKTGTLTRNLMNFKALSVEGQLFGDQHHTTMPSVPNVDFQDSRILAALHNPQHPLHASATRTLAALATCHSILLEQRQEDIVYNATSPDELALVNFCKACGWQYVGMDEQNRVRIMLHHRQAVRVYHLLLDV